MISDIIHQIHSLEESDIKKSSEIFFDVLFRTIFNLRQDPVLYHLYKKYLKYTHQGMTSIISTKQALHSRKHLLSFIFDEITDDEEVITEEELTKLYSDVSELLDDFENDEKFESFIKALDYIRWGQLKSQTNDIYDMSAIYRVCRKKWHTL